MKASKLFLKTLKESPAEAELVSHKLMHRAGLIYKNGSGLYSWLPFGIMVIRNIERIIHEEMQKVGSQEILMISVQPSDLWKKSGRWEKYGSELIRMKDRHDRDFCIGPTHEEVITNMIGSLVHSYKDLPLNFYQIQTKFRDEIRPRFGVMRSREFLMKDAYSFHLTDEDLDKTYDDMYQAYIRIFTRIGLIFRAVAADTGQIGGNGSHEFQVLANSGEDMIAVSDESDYAANIELAVAYHNPSQEQQKLLNIEKVNTPDTKSIESVISLLNIEKKNCVKALVLQGRNHTDKNLDLVVVFLRGDHDLNELKAEKLSQIKSPISFASEHELKKAGLVEGFIGPHGINIPYIVDREASSLVNFCSGANEKDYHFINTNWQQANLSKDKIYDIRFVKEGDISPDGKGKLKFMRGIEVGHVFKLGRTYTQSMEAKVASPQGDISPTMGCYGIGVSRIVAASIEQHHDEKGIIWPESIAPFRIAIATVGYHKNEIVKSKANEIYDHISSSGYSVLLDDRDLRIGQMLSDLELIGIPNVLVISERNLKENCIEYKSRIHEDSKSINIQEFSNWLSRNIPR